MSLPSKEQITGNVTEAQFKNGMNNIVDFLMSVDKQSLLLNSEAELELYEPVYRKLAKTLDTGKIWKGDGVEWQITDLSDKDIAIQYASLEIKKHIGPLGNVSNLFEFNDVNDKTVAVIRPDGDIANDQYSLNRVGEKTDQLIERNQNQLQSSLAKSLFDFEDESGKTVVAFIEDGDITTPRGSFYENLDEIDAIKIKTQNIESNDAESLHEFADESGRVTHALLADGDILFDGGRSLVKELDALSDSRQNTRKTPVSTLEYLTPEFATLMMQGLAFNGSTARASIFTGVAQQSYSFNRDDFLNLKITQSAPILIETPYYPGVSFNFPDSEVVHPYICEFKESIHEYKYLMIVNPFHRTFDVYENPVVYGSNDLKQFDMLDKFEQPLASAFRSFYHDYNSDSFAAYDHTTGEFCMIYRHTIHPESISYAYSNLYIRRTTDFVNWTESKKLLKADGSDKFDPVSPSIVFNPSLNKWMLFGVAYNAANQRQELCYQLSDQLDKGWSEVNFVTFENNVDHIIFWHQEVRYCGDKFICIVNDVLSETDAKDGKGDLYLGVSDDGITWKFSQTSIFTGVYNNPYKASISPFIENNQLGFNVVWTDNGNEVDGWKLYSAKTAKIGVI